MNAADAQRHGRLPIAKHGTVSKYNTGCRCLPCRTASTRYHRRRRAERKAAA